MSRTTYKKPRGSGEANRNKFYSDYNKDRNRKQIDYALTNSVALGVLPALLARWLPNGVTTGNEYQALNPVRNDSSIGSFSINLRTGKWADFASGDSGGDVISLAAYLGGLKQSEAAIQLMAMLGMNHD